MLEAHFYCIGQHSRLILDKFKFEIVLLVEMSCDKSVTFLIQKLPIKINEYNTFSIAHTPNTDPHNKRRINIAVNQI